MTNLEKCELLKDTIVFLYSKEGRPISYISRLLLIDRKTLSVVINQRWKLEKAKPRRHATPSVQKFINKHRDEIKKMFDDDMSVTDVAKELGVSRDFIQRTVLNVDDVLMKAHDDSMKRRSSKHNERIEELKDRSGYDYNFEDLDGEEWRPILGYDGYAVSSYGRVKSYSARYDSWHLMKATPNKNNGRMYIALRTKDNNGNVKAKNLQLARVVALTFIPNEDSTRCTVNHKDGNVENNTVSNLEWMTQAENNQHAHDNLPRKKMKSTYDAVRRTYKYKQKYEFKTIEALARFMGKSATQVTRYLETPEKYQIEIISNL